MKNKNESYKSAIISAGIGGIFFATTYLALNMSILPSLGIAIAAFGAGNLLLSDEEKKKDSNDTKTFYEILSDAKKQNAKIYEVMNKIEDKELVKNISEVHDTIAKIIDTISKNPKKLDNVHNFFDYYLPVTLKILLRYDEIENQKLNSTDSKKMMESTSNMISKINVTFKEQLSKLYQTEIIDTDAEIKVFEQMLNIDGYNEDFNKNKGG